MREQLIQAYMNYSLANLEVLYRTAVSNPVDWDDGTIAVISEAIRRKRAQ